MEGIEGRTYDLVFATSEIGEFIGVERARHRRRRSQSGLVARADDSARGRDDGESDRAVDQEKRWSINISDRVVGQPIHDRASAERRLSPHLVYAAQRQLT